MLDQDVLVSRQAKAQYARSPQNRDSPQFRFELNEDCLQKQLATSASQREDAQRRLALLQEKRTFENDIRDDLKAELRSGFNALQLQFLETSSRVVSDVRTSLNVSCQDLTSLCSAITDLRQASIRADNKSTNQQLDNINLSLNKVLSSIQMLQRSHVDTDFSVVSRAIEESQASVILLLRQAVADLKQKTEHDHVEEILDDHKCARDEQLAHVSKNIRDNKAPNTGECDSPMSRVRQFDGDLLRLENMLRENATAMASGFSELQGFFTKSNSISRQNSELECEWKKTMEQNFFQLQALVNQRASDLKESLEKQDFKIELKSENQRILELIRDGMQKGRMDVIDQLEKAASHIQQVVSTGVVDHSDHVTKQVEKLAPIGNALRELREDMTKLLADHKNTSDEQLAHASKLICDNQAQNANLSEEYSIATPSNNANRSFATSDDSPMRRFHQRDGDLLRLENMLRENATAMASGFSELQGFFTKSNSITRQDSELECEWQKNMEQNFLQLQTVFNQCSSDLKESLEKQDFKIELKSENQRILELIHDGMQKSRMEVIDQLDNAASQIQQVVSTGVVDHSDHFTKQLEKLAPIGNALRELREDMTECFAELNTAIKNRTRVDLAPLMDAIQERNQIQQDPGTPMSPSSGMGGGAVKKMSDEKPEVFPQLAELHGKVADNSDQLQQIKAILLESQVNSMREAVETPVSKLDSEMVKVIKIELQRAFGQETQKAIAELRKEVSAVMVHPSAQANSAKLQSADSRLPRSLTPETLMPKKHSGPIEGELETSQGIVHLQDLVGESKPSQLLAVPGDIIKKSSVISSLSGGSNVDPETLRGLEELFQSEGDRTEPEWMVNLS